MSFRLTFLTLKLIRRAKK